MKLALPLQNVAFILLLLATRGPANAVAAAPPVVRAAATLTAFDEGKADGNAYRISVQRDPNGIGLIAQQIQAAQSAATANPAAALYFQGYVVGLEPSHELTTLLSPRP
ncbi:hypothetical protein ACFQ48_10905 [Hymenobacter caeli]|uniref:Uncharacterized protein n=1 Tax=Hymenobacter caeli TaxID=2735894 RepID=A0ABX2FRW7_9BACT|nr:hypothetical protein [Hymenobacter caeli]NRT19930.1 hypothetical protein [Hymenobacter caeli]